MVTSLCWTEVRAHAGSQRCLLSWVFTWMTSTSVSESVNCLGEYWSSDTSGVPHRGHWNGCKYIYIHTYSIYVYIYEHKMLMQLIKGNCDILWHVDIMSLKWNVCQTPAALCDLLPGSTVRTEIRGRKLLCGMLSFQPVCATHSTKHCNFCFQFSFKVLSDCIYLCWYTDTIVMRDGTS